MDKHALKKIATKGVVNCLEFSPHYCSSNLLAVASYFPAEQGSFCNQICLSKLVTDKSGTTNKEEPTLRLEVLKEFGQERTITSLSWSPLTVIDAFPYHLELCCGNVDGKVYLIKTDLKEESQIELVGSHRKHVNSVEFDCHEGKTFASVSDDHRCKLWTTDGNELHEWPLNSPGMDVQFHKFDPTKLAVAERCGVIRFYDLTSFSAFMSVDCGMSSLKSFSWSQSDLNIVYALTESQCLLFDTTQSSFPLDERITLNTDSSHSPSRLRVAPDSQTLVAVSGGRENHVRVYNIQRGDKIISEVSVPSGSGFSWHNLRNLIACGGDNSITLLSVPN